MMCVKWLNCGCGPQNKTTITTGTYRGYVKGQQGLSKAPRQKCLSVAVHIFMAHVCLLHKYWIMFFKFTKSASFLDKFLRSQDLQSEPSHPKYQ